MKVSEAERRMPPLGAGRRAAGLALLGWLDDERAPRLCRIIGSPGAGKSHLLAWLVRGCTMGTTPSGQRIHGVVPAAGLSLRGAVWTLGQQFNLVAHSPGELLAAIGRDDRRTVICVPEFDRAAEPGRLVSELLNPLLEMPHVRLLVEASQTPGFEAVPEPAVLDLDEPRWTDREQFASWCAEAGADGGGYPSPGRALGESPTAEDVAALVSRIPAAADGSRDLRAADEELLTKLWEVAGRAADLGPLATDPVLYALARPTAVTTAVEGRDDILARAWQAAGPGLIDEPDPGVRAAVLRTRLLGVDDKAAAALTDVPGGWTTRWVSWGRGAVEMAAAGPGPYTSQLLVADRDGTVRTYDSGTGRRTGVVVVPGPKPLRGLAVTSGGTVVLLDSWGGTGLLAPDQSWPGLEPHQLTEAIEAIREGAAELTTVAAVGRLPGAAPAFGDAAGAVHWAEPDEILSAQLHQGPVTALAAVALGGGLSEPDLPLLLSGGLDGTVQLWGPASEPMSEASDRRDCPVTAVAAGATAAGALVAAAWSDGLVRVRDLGGAGGVLDIRPGSEIWSMALIGTLLVLGMPDGLATIDLRRRGGP
ncbi:WD40 repeat domain-containing protein [Saccharothrix sp. ST-888]|uniref:WD40 repeat domain-containing protein n=1 Tax=Saccharothrix sp. ST-888 TaxID=1427391 RepID=UPI0005ED1A47|nr:WD40 repeat domain-containing protein [Saccharothrix sp. ST-888]KJK55542.1 hypothetical protein UK12_27970 [Saccharothrix sp. ST-888]